MPGHHMWARATDDRGNTYYYHALTRESRWDVPSDDVLVATRDIESAARGAFTRILIHATLWERIGRAFRVWSGVARHLASQTAVVVPRMAPALDAWMAKREQVRSLRARNDDLVEDLAIARVALQQLTRDLASERLDRAQTEFERLQSAARANARIS